MLPIPEVTALTVHTDGTYTDLLLKAIRCRFDEQTADLKKIGDLYKCCPACSESACHLSKELMVNSARHVLEHVYGVDRAEGMIREW